MQDKSLPIIAGNYYVIIVGRVYLKDPDVRYVVLVAQNLAHAHRFKTIESAKKILDKIKTFQLKKNVRILKVKIELQDEYNEKQNLV